ncbi:MAG TPA: T9SS type A sorting domain-containing protein [Flavobacteriia bacterium]|nr:T9SS type A sorting domain-containing protein [Flavobacteriia bacterium]
MKFFFFSVFSLFTILSFSQYVEDAPWVKELHKTNKKNSYTIKEIANAFDAYWKKHQDEKDKKGSGYKPFKRWENHWKLQMDKNGYPISNKTIQQQWEAKQSLQRNSNDVSNWQNLGPYTQLSKSGQGRLNVIAVDPNNPNTYYVGAPAGGIWKSIDAGLSWTPLSDYLPQIGVSGIAIDPNNSDIIYIATGDDDANDTYSVGVMKSIDGGITWNTTGLQFTNSGETSGEIYINPSDSNMLWVATSVGAFKTIDGGQNWNLILAGNIRDLKLHPNNPSIIYAASSNAFYRSTNAGDTFTAVTSGLPASSNRIVIDVTPANPNIVYLLSANSSYQFGGLYKSTDSGVSFSRTNEYDDIFNSSQAWYDLALTVSDNNENIVFVGVLDIWKSTDGGNDFVKINNWYAPSEPAYTHADIHFLRYFNGDLYCGSDGGIYKSTNDGISFTELNEGLSISQIYRIANARQNATNIAGGLQDNGGFGYSNNNWNQYHGGDGMDCAVDPNNPNKYYGFSQYGGSLNVTYDGGLTGQGVVSAPEQGNWITPMFMNNDGELFAGFSKLYQLTAINTWFPLSGSIFAGRISNIEIAPNDVNTIFVSSFTSLYKSTDKGFNFTQIYTATNTISSIEINNDNPNIIYLTTSSGENGQVLKSVDAGNSFTDITGNLPSESKLIIKHVPHNFDNDLYVGTSLGVYHINDTMANWETFATNLPNVPVMDLEINFNDHKLLAATYGRGVFVTDITIVPPADDIQLVTIETPNDNVLCGDTLSPEILVKNQGTNVINEVNFNYDIDGTPYTYTYNGQIQSLQTATISLPNITGLSLGEHLMQVTATIPNDAYIENNTSYTKFYINSISNPTNLNTFNNPINDSWMVTGTQQVWEIANPTTTNLGVNSNIGYVTVASSNYPDNVSSYLTSPCYDMTVFSSATMKFDLAFDLEQDWDVLYVQYSVDQGDNWEVLGDASDPNWYNSNYSANQLTIGKQWTGTDATIKEYSHDVSFLNNEPNVIFRFAFLSDQAVNNEGVLIDNFVIEGVAAINENELSNTIHIYPNPSNGIYTIERKTNTSLSIGVYDITGKRVYFNTNESNTKFTINLSNLENGVYFVNLKSDKDSVTKKIIKN